MKGIAKNIATNGARPYTVTMNFLAHLHLASLANSSLLGNLMADFVRGNPWKSWPQSVAAGITLHRRVDTIADNLPEVRAMRARFSPTTQRVALITLDIVWDHFLSLHWQHLHPTEPLPAFLLRAQAALEPLLSATPVAFQNLNRHIWHERWLEHYAEVTWVQKVLNSLADRRPRLSALRDSWQDFINNYPLLEQSFWQFYPRLMVKAKTRQL